MKKYIFILVAIVLMACEKTIFVGGTVTDLQSGDSIEGLNMGLYVPKPEYTVENAKWSDLDLIAMGTTNSDGFFSMEIDEGTNVCSLLYCPLPPTDTLSVNAKYTSSGSENFYNVGYGTSHVFELARSSHVQVKLINFTQEKIKMSCADGVVTIESIHNYSNYLYFVKLLAGQKYKLDFYSVTSEYLGSTSRYIKTQLPDDSDKVKWIMPLQVIEVDYNTLEK